MKPSPLSNGKRDRAEKGQAVAQSRLRRAIICLCLLVTGSACSATSTQGAIPGVPSPAHSNTPATGSASTSIPEPTVTPAWHLFTEETLGLRFQFPPRWHGPEVYAWAEGVRLEVGSDRVNPYGTDPLDRVYQVTNSYYIVIQYTRNSAGWTQEQYRANQPWTETYWSLLNLKDGESLSGLRDLRTRLRALAHGSFTGLEYISTLSDTAQTEFFYVRQVVLFDEHLNALTVIGTPTNIEVAEKAQWQQAYRQVDEANAEVFHRLVESIEIE